MNFLIRIGIILVGLCIPILGLTDTVIEIQEDFKPFYIGAFLETQETQERTTTLDEIVRSNNWVSQNTSMFNSTATGDLWVKFKVHNTSATTKNMALVLEAPLLDQVQFFSFQNTELIDSSLKMGNTFPFEQRAIQHRFPTYNFQLQPFQEIIIYGSMIEEYKYIPVHLKLYQQVDLLPVFQKDIIYKLLLIVPILLLVIIGILFNFYALKNYNIFFTLHSVCILLFLLGVEGLGFQYLWPNSTWIQKGFPIFYIFSLFFSSIAFPFFLKIRKNTKSAKLFYLVIGIQLVVIAYTFYYLIADQLKSIEMVFAISILSSYLLIILSVLFFYKKIKLKAVLLLVYMYTLNLIVGLFVVIDWIYDFNLEQYISNFELFSSVFSAQAMFIYFLGIIYFYRQIFAYRKVESQLAEKQNEALQNLLKGQESERKRLSRSLHDGLGIRLLQVKQCLNDMKENLNQDCLSDALFQINGIHRDIRNISHALNPTVLQEYGLEKAINDIIFRIELYNLDLDIQLEYPNNLLLHKDQSKHFYYIIQELLNNTVKYAKANSIRIEFKKVKDSTYFYYYDNGIGFELEHMNHSGIGLQNIKSRVALMNGHLKLIPRKPRGIELRIYILHQSIIQGKANHISNRVEI